ncbi:uncharacterized protein [Hemitrygon akajei]|uniref:uncharacterized protein n=1 Tax=Hemitrygon akajei TaxID=2704970 RepID=UPI003BFA1F4E
MATPKKALQALLDRRFELVCNGWVPVSTEPQLDFPDKVSAPSRWRGGNRAPNPWKKLGISPIRLLFRGRVNMGKVCDWFMQTTETRSLTIAKKTNFRRRLRGKGFRAARRTRAGATKARSAKARAKTRGRMASGRGRRRNLGRRDASVCNPQIDGSHNWLGRQLEERRYNLWQREPPPATSPRSQSSHSRESIAPIYVPALSPVTYDPPVSPPVISVKGTRYKMVPVGNALPTSEKMQETKALGESRPRHPSQRPAPLLLGCLRECWVLLRNIELPRSSEPWPDRKVAKVGRGRRQQRGRINAHPALGRSRPGFAHRTPRVAGRQLSNGAVPPRDLPPQQSRPDGGPTIPVQWDCTLQKETVVQQDDLLADVHWQLVGLKECRVILRKIKVLDESRRNGCVGGLPSKTTSPCKHPKQSLQGRGAEVKRPSEFHGTAFCEKNPKQSLATSNRGASVSAFAKKELQSTNQ